MSGNQVLDRSIVQAHDSSYRVIIFTSVEACQVKQLLRHLIAALPNLRLIVVYQSSPARRPIDPNGTLSQNPALGLNWIRTTALNSATGIKAASIKLLDRCLDWLHSSSDHDTTFRNDDLKAYAESNGVQFLFTEDSNSQTTKEFVRSVKPDLGVVFGGLPTDMNLFGIPRDGFLTLDVCEVRTPKDADPLRPSRPHDQTTIQSITVHRVVANGDIGPALGERTFILREFDTQDSIAVKSSLLGTECLVDVLRSELNEDTQTRPRSSIRASCLDRSQQRIGKEDRFALRNHRSFRPRYGRPLAKLLARFLLYPRVYLLNRRRVSNQSFPIVILYGHIIADRPHFMGLSTDQFLKQVRFLKKHYHVASLPDAIEMMRVGKVHAPTVVLTLDDGYDDNHLGLRAVIDLEELPVTLFVCSKNVEDRRPFNHDIERGEIGFDPLTWDQVIDFERQGSTIGSHTRRHFDCGSRDEELLREEIVGAQEDFRQHLGHEVPYFSFPWGRPKNMSPSALRIASQTYPYLFAAYGGLNEVGVNNSPLFKRVSWPESLLELELSLQGILDFGRDELTKELDPNALQAASFLCPVE